MIRHTRASERSLVAGVNALFRSNESERAAEDRILSDPWAALFAEHDPRVAAIRYSRFVLPELRRMIDQLQTAHCVRHRTIDELTLDAVRRGGYRQVVSVGAGYDMRPSRFKRELEGVLWIEVDHPATMTRKQRILAARSDVDLRVERVSIDLLTDALLPALSDKGFASEQPACFILEGVIHYLTTPRLEALLAAMEGATRSRRVILSFIKSDMYRSAPSLFIRLVRILHEIPELHFSVDGIASLFGQHGLSRWESFGIAEQIERFAPHAKSRPIGVSQDVAVADSGRD
jgi:methyltransferase (TIGR00027 family)